MELRMEEEEDKSRAMRALRNVLVGSDLLVTTLPTRHPFNTKPV